MELKILLDTDIGTNIDDSLALAYLLRNPECRLVGITTVTGQAGKRAVLAREMCEAAGHKVPVYPGSEVPLLIEQGQTEVPLASHSGMVLESRDGNQDEMAGEAVHFLRSAIRANPGEITLLTTGPLTNIARLFQFDPEIPSHLRMMVSMAGVYFPKARTIRSRETNIMLDPHAAAEVFSMSPEKTRVVGLDVTMSCWKRGEEAAALVEGFSLSPLNTQLMKWLKKSGNVFFHDPLAAVLIFEPDLCTWKEGRVTIDGLTGKCGIEVETAGKGIRLPHLVACTVDSEGFFQKFSLHG